MTARASQLLEIAILTVVYVVTAKLGLHLDPVSGFATLVWAPTGISLAALLVYGYRLWPGVALGAFLVNAWVGAPIPIAGGIALGNTVEALAAAYALRRFGFHNSLDRLRDVLALGVFAAAASPMISATIGVTSLSLGGLVARDQLADTWLAWWWGDLAGALLVAPLLLTWCGNRVERVLGRPRRSEAIALALSLALVGAVVFFGVGPSWLDSFRQAYSLVPIAIWAGVRFGPRGAASTSFLYGSIAGIAAVLGFGPFVAPTLHESLLGSQSFMAIWALTTLSLGAIAVERASQVAATRQSEVQKTAMLEAALDAVVTMDHAGNIREFNAAAERVFGVQRADAIGNEMAALLIPPSLRDAHRKGLARYLRTGKHDILGKRVHFDALRADGTVFPAEIAIIRVAIEGPPMFTGFIRDITAQRQAELEVQRSREELEQKVEERVADLRRVNLDLARREEQLREAQALARFGSFEWDLEQAQVSWSDELYRIYGLEPGIPISAGDFLERTHPDDRARVRTTVENALVDHQPFRLEERIIRPDGSVRVLQSEGKVELSSAGRPVRVRGACQDITEHRLSEQVRSRLAAIVESSEDAIVGWTLDGMIESWNRGAEKIYGYSAEEAIGRPMTLVVPEGRHDDRERIVSLIRAGERAVGSETVRRRKDGSLFEASVTTSPILDLAGRLIGIATIVRDVTELKDSLKLKEVLLREIHHRVKNNLQVIASLLRLQASTVAGDEARRGFEESQNRIRSMALVHQLLYQSKDLASIDFEEYLRDLVDWLARSYGLHAGRIDFAVTAPGMRLDIDTSVPCGLIVNELVSNSLKHAFPDGRHGLVAVSLHRDGDGPYVLMVKDDGIGIAEHLQLETVRTLGLRIVSMLTAQLHGTVAVFRDHGTTFRITFPPPRHTHQ